MNCWALLRDLLFESYLVDYDFHSAANVEQFTSIFRVLRSTKMNMRSLSVLLLVITWNQARLNLVKKRWKILNRNLFETAQQVDKPYDVLPDYYDQEDETRPLEYAMKPVLVLSYFVSLLYAYFLPNIIAPCPVSSKCTTFLIRTSIVTSLVPYTSTSTKISTSTSLIKSTYPVTFKTTATSVTSLTSTDFRLQRR